MSNDDKASRWLAKLTRLNPASARSESRGKAPHKPLLLLSLLDMAESGELTSSAFTRSPGLVLRFRNYGSITAARWQTRLDIRMPFFYLSNQGFWEPLARSCRRCDCHENCADNSFTNSASACDTKRATMRDVSLMNSAVIPCPE